MTSRQSADTSRVAANVRAELARQCRTRRDLAAATGIDEYRVNKRVRGLVPFSADEIAAVARFLGVAVEQLVEPPADQVPRRRSTDRDTAGAA